MSNLMKVPHTIQFLATIDLDKIEAHLLPTLISLSESDLAEMCKGATLSALAIADVLTVANENGTWAELSIAE